MGPLSYMRSVVDRKVGMRCMIVIGNSGFRTRNDLSKNNPQFGHAPSLLFASHVLGRKTISILSGAEYLICLGPPHISGRLCHVG